MRGAMSERWLVGFFLALRGVKRPPLTNTNLATAPPRHFATTSSIQAKSDQRLGRSEWKKADAIVKLHTASMPAEAPHCSWAG